MGVSVLMPAWVNNKSVLISWQQRKRVILLVTLQALECSPGPMLVQCPGGWPGRPCQPRYRIKSRQVRRQQRATGQRSGPVAQPQSCGTGSHSAGSHSEAAQWAD